MGISNWDGDWRSSLGIWIGDQDLEFVLGFENFPIPIHAILHFRWQYLVDVLPSKKVNPFNLKTCLGASRC